jgi:lipid-binding SYLF domain-containing protein
MKKLYIILACLLASCGTVDRVKSKFAEQRNIIKSENTVTPEDALETLRRANRKSAFNYSISRQSVAHVVFPKIMKAGFLLGGNYGEGYLIRDGEVMALIDVSGGNLGLQAGGQTFAQVTYILSEQKYTELRNNNRVSISGTLAYGRHGQIDTSVLSSDAFTGDLYTVILDETGTIFGASVEGLYYTVRK